MGQNGSALSMGECGPLTDQFGWGERPLAPQLSPNSVPRAKEEPFILHDAYGKKSSFFAETSDTTRVPPSVTQAVFRNTRGCELWGMFLPTSKAMLMFVTAHLAVQ